MELLGEPRQVSALFAVSIVIQQIAHQGTSVTNASFLVNTATVMTPPAAWLLTGERATAIIWFAAGAVYVGRIKRQPQPGGRPRQLFLFLGTCSAKRTACIWNFTD